MPVAAAIPAALGVAGIIAGNAQQKAAQKNNDNQQAMAVQNANDASAAGKAQYESYLASHPSPLQGLMMGARPMASNAIQGNQNVNASSLFAGGSQPMPGGQQHPPMDLQSIIAHMMSLYGAAPGMASRYGQTQAPAPQSPMPQGIGAMNTIHPIPGPQGRL